MCAKDEPRPDLALGIMYQDLSAALQPILTIRQSAFVALPLSPVSIRVHRVNAKAIILLQGHLWRRRKNVGRCIIIYPTELG